MLKHLLRESPRSSTNPRRAALAAIAGAATLGLAMVAAPRTTEAKPVPAACVDKGGKKADLFDWQDIVARNEQQLRADTRLLARGVAGIIADQRNAAATQVIRELAARREACFVVNDTAFCDFDVTFSQLGAGLAARGMDLRKLLLASLKGAPAGEFDLSRIEKLAPVIEIEGVRIDPFIRVTTLDTAFYPKGPALPDVVIAGQIEPNGKEAIGYGDLNGDGVIESTSITRQNFPNHVLWAVGLNITNREIPDKGPVGDLLLTPLAPCKKHPSSEGGGCGCRTSLPHWCGSRCFIGCWGAD